MGYLDQNLHTYLFKYCSATGMQNDKALSRIVFVFLQNLLTALHTFLGKA